MNCKFCNKECKNDNSLRNHERLCKLNPNRQLTTYEKYGPIKGFNFRGTRKGCNQYIKAKDLGLPKPEISLETRLKLSNFNKLHNNAKRPEVRQKISDTMKKVCLLKPRKGSGKGKQGYYKGYYCQSSWELAFVIYNLEHNVTFERNKKSFTYIYENEEHQYYPDFYIPTTNTYIEIKGYYDIKSKEKSRQFKGKLLILQKEDMKIYLDYCINKYGKDFVNLYEK